MNTPVNAILFDLDGTLLDTAPDFAVVLNQLRHRHGHEPLNYQAIRGTVSNGARALITLAFDKTEGDEGFEDLRQELLALYTNHLAVKTCLFPTLDRVLDWLDERDTPWGIVTNKPSLYTDPILQALELAERCGSVVCPDHVSNTKPDPEPLLLACQHLDCLPEETIYIGDHRRDIEAGRRAGMRTVAAGYGYIDHNDPAQHWQADFSVDHPQDLLPLIKQFIDG